MLSGPGKPDKVTLLVMTLPAQSPSVHTLAAELDVNVGTDVWEAQVDNETVAVSWGSS